MNEQNLPLCVVISICLYVLYKLGEYDSGRSMNKSPRADGKVLEVRL